MDKPVTREKMREYQREWRARNLEKHQKQARRRHLAKAYGLTIEALAEMMARQDGHCAVCGVQLLERYAIDHDHKTGKVRGLLCSKCNSALGMADDSPDRLRALIVYLERHQ